MLLGGIGSQLAFVLECLAQSSSKLKALLGYVAPCIWKQFCESDCYYLPGIEVFRLLDSVSQVSESWLMVSKY